jgi:hypothetical protein
LKPRHSSSGTVTWIVRGLAEDAADQTSRFELDDHLVDSGWRDLEEPPEIGPSHRTTSIAGRSAPPVVLAATETIRGGRLALRRVTASLVAWGNT